MLCRELAHGDDRRREKLTMRRAPATGIPLAANKTAAANISQRRRLAVTECDINVLPPPRPCPRQQSGQDAVARVQARRQVRDRDADLDRRPVTVARNVHKPELGLDHDIVASAIGVGPCLAVSRDGGIDQPRVNLPQRLVIHAVLAQRAGEVILHQDVALRSQFVQDLNARGVLEGEADRLFVAIYLRASAFGETVGFRSLAEIHTARK